MGAGKFRVHSTHHHGSIVLAYEDASAVMVVRHAGARGCGGEKQTVAVSAATRGKIPSNSNSTGLLTRHRVVDARPVLTAVSFQPNSDGSGGKNVTALSPKHYFHMSNCAV